MVNSLKNKNRTDRPKITVKSLKETVDQCDFEIFIFYGKIKKSSIRKKLKYDLVNLVKNLVWDFSPKVKVKVRGSKCPVKMLRKLYHKLCSIKWTTKK
jgi:hypothetical protein